MNHEANLARLSRRLTWEEIDPAYLGRLIGLARDEDLAAGGLKTAGVRAGDPTTEALGAIGRGSARLVAREALCVCGLPLLPYILQTYGGSAESRIDLLVDEGDRVEAGTALAILQCELSPLLSAERVLLNFLQHLSGIATNTATYVDALGDSPTRLLDTRKTTPGFRVLEKYAVGRGGGWNHRLGLYDRIMIKDNHLAAGNVAKGERLAGYVRRAAASRPDLPVEVEIDALDQLAPVLEARPDVILLDNFATADLRKAVERIDGACATEASGGIDKNSLRELGRLGLTFISSGALTHGSRWTDIALDWEV